MSHLSNVADIIGVCRHVRDNDLSFKSMTADFGEKLVGKLLSRELISFLDSSYCHLTEKGQKLITASNGIQIGVLATLPISDLEDAGLISPKRTTKPKIDRRLKAIETDVKMLSHNVNLVIKLVIIMPVVAATVFRLLHVIGWW